MLSYIVLLGISRVCCRDNPFKTHVYHHMNIVATVAFVLAIVQDLLPVVIVGSTYRPSPLGTALLACLAVVVVVILASPRPTRPFLPDTESDETPVKEEEVSPEETCSPFSYYCSYEWITYVILRGCQRDLTMDDLPPLPAYDQPLKWLEKAERQRLKGGKTFRTLCRLLKTEINAMMGWSASTAVIEFLAPFSMLRLLAYLENPHQTVVHPAVWIALLFLGPAARSLCYQQYIFVGTRLLVRVNMSLVQEIYQTAMRSHIYDESGEGFNDDGKAPSKGESKSGQANLTSLMSYDVDAIYNSRDIFYVATACPISTTLAMVFLYQMLGWPSLFGVLALVLMTPLPTLASRKVSRIQQSVMRATDVRLAKISEYLHSIRTIKYFGWEPAAANTINAVRGTEQRRLWKRNVHAAAISMTGDLLPLISLLVMFSVFVLFSDRTLRAPIAFTSMSIMETLRFQFIWLSNVSRFSAQGAESLRRVDQFFDSVEEIKRHPEGPLELNNATFRRTPIAAFRLRDISIRFQQNALNVLTGPTGCGKTSLLQSLLGETVLESGNATAPRDIAYVPQEPWLQNDTIKQNVLFYSTFDEQRYNTVIEASGLAQDLQQLPLGDLTAVGERGTSLSGGQKQRVSLARALYSRSSTLLLDDIFSALDTHTTSLVYKKCFRSGLLADRTVVLITSLPAAMHDAELVVRMEHGRVSSAALSDSLQSSRTATPTVEELQTSSTLTSNSHEATETETHGPLTAHVISNQPAAQEQEATGTRRTAKETSATGRVPRTLCKSQ